MNRKWSFTLDIMQPLCPRSWYCRFETFKMFFIPIRVIELGNVFNLSKRHKSLHNHNHLHALFEPAVTVKCGLWHNIFYDDRMPLKPLPGVGFRQYKSAIESYESRLVFHSSLLPLAQSWSAVSVAQVAQDKRQASSGLGARKDARYIG